MTTETAPAITTLAMDDGQLEFAEQIAYRLGYSQTAYTTTGGLWGLSCLRDNSFQKQGCVILTKEFGFMFISDLNDLNLHDLAEQERATV